MMSKMVSIILGISMLGSVAFADFDFDVHGQISSVDNANKTITLAGANGQLVIKVLPYTEIKGDDCGAFGQDIYGSFKDLSVGKFVKVEAVPHGGYNAYNDTNAQAINPKTQLPADMQLVAKEIEWKCVPRAY